MKKIKFNLVEHLSFHKIISDKHAFFMNTSWIEALAYMLFTVN